MKKIIEERRREKVEEAAARSRIKAKIELDKIARRNKYGMASPDGATEQPAAAPASTPAPAPVQQPVVPKDYTETKLNVSLVLLKLVRARKK